MIEKEYKVLISEEQYQKIYEWGRECQNNQNNDSNICDDININSDTSNICNCLMENNTSGCRYSRKYWH